MTAAQLALLAAIDGETIAVVPEGWTNGWKVYKGGRCVGTFATRDAAHAFAAQLAGCAS